jgi:CubicO group peptidase (beta-lactamase class C family)
MSMIGINVSTAQVGKENIPDMDPVVFKNYMNSKLKGAVKGYAFYLTKSGNYVTSDAGGIAKTSQDNNGKVMPYTINTLQEIASVSKMITAVAILRALEKSPAVDVNSKIGPWLPKGWKQSASFGAITFSQLLSHMAGLREDNSITGTYEEVMEKYALKTMNLDSQKVSSYLNLNFQILRVLLPNIISATYRQQDLLWTSELNNKKITRTQYNALLADNGSAIYRNYVMEYLFKPAGITAPTCNPVGHPNLAWAYENKNSTKGAEGKDHTLYCSSGFWQVSAKDFAVLMTKVMHSEDIISNSTKLIINNTSNKNTVGWSYKLKRGNGYNYGHGGDINWGLSEVHSYLLYMPGNYVAYVHINSGEFGSWSLRGLLYQAYDSARKFPYNCYNSGTTYQFPNASVAGHIAKVGFGKIQQASGKSTGYTYYNNYVTSFKQDSSYSLTLKSNYESKMGMVYWAVWIDYDQDGVFQTSERIYAIKSVSGLEQKTHIKIPTSATKGITRMRVALKRHDTEVIADACTSFSYGEIEDYNIDITKPCGILANLKAVNISSTGASLIFDKPVDKVLHYVLRYQWVGAATWTIVNPPLSSPYSYITQDVANLKPNTTYRWHVRSSCGDFSAYKTFTTRDVNICGTDLYEANLNTSNAKTINLGETKTALICSSTLTADQDWFKFNVTSNTLLGTKVKIDLTSLPADYDLYLYSEEAGPIASSLKRGLTNELIEKTLPTGVYYIKVIGFSGAEHTHYYYQISIKKSDAIATLSLAEPIDETSSIASEVIVFPNPANNGVMNVSFEQSLPEGVKPQVKLFESTGNEINTNFTYDTEGKLIIDTRGVEKGLYTLKVILGQKVISKRVVVQ